MPVPITPGLLYLTFTDGIIGVQGDFFNYDPTATGIHIKRGTSSGAEATITTGTFTRDGNGNITDTAWTAGDAHTAFSQWTDRTVINDTPYFYIITLINGSGESLPSNELSQTATAVTCDSTYVSQSIPTVMQTGLRYGYSITWTNTGTKIWSDAAHVTAHDFGDMGDVFPITETWGSQNVSNGQNGTLTGIITAPTTLGTYTFRGLQLQVNATDVEFGDYSPDATFTVVAYSAPNDGFVEDPW